MDFCMIGLLRRTVVLRFLCGIIILLALNLGSSAQIPGSSLQVWLRADSDNVTYNQTSKQVSNWDNAFQYTAAAQPLFENPGVNAKPAIQFLTGDSMTFPGKVANGTYNHMHAFIVAKPSSAPGFAPLISTGDQDGWLIRYDGTTLEYVHPNGTQTNPKVSMPGANGWRILEVERQGLNVYLRVDGFDKDAGYQSLVSYTSTPNGNSTLGNYRSTWLNDGRIAEVIIYDTALSSGDRDIVLAYLAQKYNRPLRYPGFPSVTLTNPANESSYGQSESVTLQASTFSNTTGVYISKTEFFRDGTKIGEQVAPAGTGSWEPTLSWTPGTVGDFEMSAKTTLTNGNAFLSPTIVVHSINEPPEITWGPTATPNPTQGTNAQLTATVTDDRPVSELSYKWYSALNPELPPPTFSPNDSNAALNTTATFSRAGTYYVRLEARDANGGVTVSPYVELEVQQSSSILTVSPQTADVTFAVKKRFTATAIDQFGVAIEASPLVIWSTTGGSIDRDLGVFTGSLTPGGPFTITATKAYMYLGAPVPDTPTVSGTAQVTVSAPSPTQDTDGDGLTDEYELSVTQSSVNKADTDSDGIPDAWEVSHGLIPTYGADGLDPFGNGLTNAQEYRRQTTLVPTDSNGDGLYDSVSGVVGLNPTLTDFDGDGWSNAQELLSGTNVYLHDTDGDDVDDPFDFYPLDPLRSSGPGAVSGDTTGPVVSLTAPLGATLN
jgi:hypothetical protein